MNELGNALAAIRAAGGIMSKFLPFFWNQIEPVGFSVELATNGG